MVTDQQGMIAMNAIRFIGAAALAATLAGCAGTRDIDPGASVAIPQSAPVETATAPVATPRAVVQPDPVALPERVAAAPRYQAAPPPPEVQTVVAEPAPRYDPVETVAVPAPPSERAPEPIFEPAPELTDVPVETAALAAPVAVPMESSPRYKAVGDLDAPAPAPVPAPVYTMTVESEESPASRAMSPIRDDPKDGRNGRRASKNETRQHARKGYRRNAALRAGGPKPKVRSNFTPSFGAKLEQAALDRINHRVRYDARYIKIGYPWGDVDESTGVCTDVVIRSYRTLGIDLQEMVHQDMKRAFGAYPSKRIYGLKRADSNIDHRRVVNLEAFFERTGASIPVGSKPGDFKPGDVLTWRLSGNEPHIGIVVSDLDPRTGFPLVVHNLGAGVRKDDLVSLSPPVGHFRFAPDRQTVVAALVTKQ